MQHCITINNFNNLQVSPKYLEEAAERSTFFFRQECFSLLLSDLMPKQSQLKGQLISKGIWEKTENQTFPIDVSKAKLH